jgi:hypothetical protein
MELEQVKQAVENTQAGANIVVEWERPCSTFKGITAVITKRVKMVGRVGIEYDNQKKVVDARENGTLPAENQGLKGMEWVEYPWLLRATKSGKLYLRLYTSTNSKCRAVSQFFLDGKAVDREAVAHLLLAKELTKSQPEACFSCAVDSILRLNRESVEAEAETPMEEQVLEEV